MHYEILFIHPFSDGNGRTARIIQTAILSSWKDIFRYMPIENLIKRNQQEYYRVIDTCNKLENSNIFIELIKKNPNITQIEMAEKLKITRDGISYNIKALKENGVIERVGSTKNGSWRILTKHS